MFVQIPDAMKKLFVYAALSVLPFVAAGERTEYELEYSPFGEEVLAGDVWDVSRLAVEDSRSKAFAGIGASGIYGERLGGRELLYLFRGDSLLFRGYTAWRIEGLLNDSLTVSVRFPLCGGTFGVAPRQARRCGCVGCRYTSQRGLRHRPSCPRCGRHCGRCDACAGGAAS